MQIRKFSFLNVEINFKKTYQNSLNTISVISLHLKGHKILTLKENGTRLSLASNIHLNQDQRKLKFYSEPRDKDYFPLSRSEIVRHDRFLKKKKISCPSHWETV